MAAISSIILGAAAAATSTGLAVRSANQRKAAAKRQTYMARSQAERQRTLLAGEQRAEQDAQRRQEMAIAAQAARSARLDATPPTQQQQGGKTLLGM